jgi:hypothetical protein
MGQSAANRRWYRPWLEGLDRRLPPGDTLLGLLATGVFLDASLSDAASLIHDSRWTARAGCRAWVNGTEQSEAPVDNVSRGESNQAINNSVSAICRSWEGQAPAERLGSAAQGRLHWGFEDSAPATRRQTVHHSSFPNFGPGTLVRETPFRNPFMAKESLRAPFPNGTLGTRATIGTGGSDADMTNGYGSTPFFFEKNEGQARDGGDFVARGPGYTLALTATEAVFGVHNLEFPNSEFRMQNSEFQNSELGVQNLEPGKQNLDVVRMHLLGGNPEAAASGVDPLITKVNYFLGNDPAKWHTNIPTFGKVHYDDVYPGIDLVYYSSQHSVVSSQHENPNLPPSPLGRGDGGEGTTTQHSPLTNSPLTTHQLEYDFMVAPGADPNQIRLSFSGADSVTLDAAGNLILQVGDTQLRQQKPIIYQEVNGTRQQVQGEFRIQNSEQNSESRIQNSESARATDYCLLSTDYSSSTDCCLLTTVYFSVGAYDTSRPLIIDPVVQRGETYLGYSTYLGGPLSDYARDIAVDKTGAAYITGEAYSGFPQVNPSQPYGGQGDAFVVKLSPDGQTLLYATYIGGSGLDSANSIAVGKNSAYITGFTESANFPSTPGAYDTVFHGSASAFIVRLGPDGGSLAYSTFLGGLSGNESGDGIAVDAAGNAYVMGQTNAPNFPVLNAVQPTYGGGSCNEGAANYPCYDAFISKLNPSGSALVYSTYLGGNRDEGSYFYGLGGDIAVDSAGHAYVTGRTQSNNFPVYNAIQPARNGGSVDAFVTKLTPDGSAFVYSTYLGGAIGEHGSGIAADAAGNAYVTGRTSSDDFPTTPGAFQPTKTGGGANPDAFIAKLYADGSAFGYSTYLGGADWDAASTIAVDPLGYAYVAGVTYSTDFPIRSPFQPGLAGGDRHDGFLTKLALRGNGLVYSSYIGGSDAGQSGLEAGADSASGIAVDTVGNTYVAGSTYAADFPLLRPLQPANGGYYDTFVTKVERFAREPFAT